MYLLDWMLIILSEYQTATLLVQLWENSLATWMGILLARTSESLMELLLEILLDFL